MLILLSEVVTIFIQGLAMSLGSHSESNIEFFSRDF